MKRLFASLLVLVGSIALTLLIAFIVYLIFVIDFINNFGIMPII